MQQLSHDGVFQRPQTSSYSPKGFNTLGWPLRCMIKNHWLSIQLKTDVVEGRLRCNHEQAIVLASYSLQVEQSISKYLLQKHNFSGGVWRPRSWEAHGRISQRLSTSPKTSGGSVWGGLRSISIQRWRVMTDANNNVKTGQAWCLDWPSGCPTRQPCRSGAQLDELCNCHLGICVDYISQPKWQRNIV